MSIPIHVPLWSDCPQRGDTVGQHLTRRCFLVQRLQEQEHSVQDLVDLNLRVPLEKEIPVTVVPEEKEDAKSADSEEEFPEITEVNSRGLRGCKDTR